MGGRTNAQTICNFTGITCQSSSSSRAPQSSVSALIITHGNEDNPSPLSRCIFPAERKDSTPVSLARQAGAASRWHVLLSNVPSHPTLFIPPIYFTGSRSTAGKAVPDPLAQSPRGALALTHHTPSGAARLGRRVSTAAWCLSPTQRGSGAQTGMEASTPHGSPVLETCESARVETLQQQH